MSAAVQPATSFDSNGTSNRQIKRQRALISAVSSTLFILLVLLTLLFWYKARSVDRALLEVRFDQFVTDYNAANDFLQPTVGTIQFLRRDYSISFEHVEYTQNGLVLGGQIGNATNLWISSLALELQCASLSVQNQRQVHQGIVSLVAR